MFLLVGSTARSEMRPDTMAGPMLRSATPENVSDFIGPVSFFFAASESFESLASLPSAGFGCAATGVRNSALTMIAARRAASRSGGGMRNLLDTMASPDGGIARGYGSRGRFAHASRHTRAPLVFLSRQVACARRHGLAATYTGRPPTVNSCAKRGSLRIGSQTGSSLSKDGEIDVPLD